MNSGAAGVQYGGYVGKDRKDGAGAGRSRNEFGSASKLASRTKIKRSIAHVWQCVIAGDS